MARKGILVSDPIVQRTSRAQWIWEYLAIQKRELTEHELQVKTMRRVMVHVLGLDLAAPLDDQGKPKPRETWTQDEHDSFVPAVFLMGNHHLAAKYFKRFQESQPDNNATGVTDDAAYDELVRKMAEEDGDMVPIIDDPLANVDLNQVVREKEAAALGIKLVDSPPTGTVKVSQAPKKKVVRRAVVSSIGEPTDG